MPQKKSIGLRTLSIRWSTFSAILFGLCALSGCNSLDLDGDGDVNEVVCDDAEACMPTMDVDFDGTLNKKDRVVSPEDQRYGFAFQNPAATDWSVFLGGAAWAAHTEFFANRDLLNGASSQSYVMRNYNERPYRCAYDGDMRPQDWTTPPPCVFHWVTQVDDTTINWRTHTDVTAMPIDIFQEHVDQMFDRLKAEDAHYLSQLSDTQLALLQDSAMNYAIDPEITLWDRAFFGDMETALFEMAFNSETGKAYPNSRVGGSHPYIYFTPSGSAENRSFTPTQHWQILAEAHIAHIRHIQTVLGHDNVSYYGGPWGVDWRDPGRALHAGLPVDRLDDLLTDAMLRVADVPLQTGTMQRFIDTMGLNGAQWYPYSHDRWPSGRPETWNRDIVEALIASLSAVSEAASPHRPKGALWLYVASTAKDFRWVASDELQRRWPGSLDNGDGYQIDSQALFPATDPWQDKSTRTGAYPLPPSIVADIATSLQEHQVVGFAFLPISALRSHKGTDATVVNSLAAYEMCDWDDDTWDPPTLQAADPETYQYIVDLTYQHILQPLRRD